ncbi:MAG: YfcE family phosphodiesterase [Clostridia bacterium]|nr:YfcE family phosphodiesterase [Clostridia bacterium]
MKILVCSDSHGMKYNLKDAYERERSEYIFFLGDGLRDLDFLELPYNVYVAAVKGNCDMAADESETRFFELENKKLLLTHGHNSHVKQGLWKLDLLAREKEADIIFYGHTHQRLETTIDNRLYLCPGALKQGDYILLELKGGQVSYTFRTLY